VERMDLGGQDGGVTRTAAPKVVFKRTHEITLATFYLPETIYSIFLVMRFLEMGSHRALERWVECQLWFLWAVNLVYQGMFTYWIYELVQVAEEGPACGGHQVSMIQRHFCLSLFVAYMVGDLYESWGMWRWMQHISDYDQPHKQLEHPEDTEESEDARLLHEEFFNSSVMFRAWLFASVIVPKVLLCLAITWFGSKMILLAGDLGSVILYSLALGFVTSVDEMFYDFCVSADMHDKIEGGLTSITMAYPRDGWVTMGPMIQMFILFGVTVILNGISCGYFK